MFMSANDIVKYENAYKISFNAIFLQIHYHLIAPSNIK